ncbi:MAG: NUDIX hydrolase [Clostridiales bacterium]|uniref:NUDIX hydrolase n=1 Tax=Clostridium sp. N3C TaxID=1776758 RepID=UPI00092E015D|nr:NUDIX hydrolase [Clostridium sp. N3C]NLZ47688.1 NUDIX hydrolase [Clostridiales bacterium]SCN21393.1 ADP-ribose pyrophosphatase [Clostridium sp. N3C]
MDYSEKTLKEERVFNGKVIGVVVQDVEVFNGKVAKREIVRHPGGVAVLALTESNKILFVEQYRKAIDKHLLELPAGKLEKGEDPKACGIRELEEETGYKAEKFTYLGKIVSSPGFCDEYIYLYKAEKLYKGTIGGDEDEFIDIKEFSIEEVKEKIKSGEIIDGKTLAALLHYFLDI